MEHIAARFLVTTAMFFALAFPVLANDTGGLHPVFDGKPANVHMREVVRLGPVSEFKYKLAHKKIESYKCEPEKEHTSAFRVFKKGRISLDAGMTSKKDRDDIKMGDRVLLQPSILVTEEVSLIMTDKIVPETLESYQELGIKFTPKKLHGSSFSVSGSNQKDKQKLKFTTDFYLW